MMEVALILLASALIASVWLNLFQFRRIRFWIEQAANAKVDAIVATARTQSKGNIFDGEA